METDKKEIVALSEILLSEKREGRCKGVGFLLADNRDCLPNDFARDAKAMINAYLSGECADVTDQVMGGGLP
ncbi:MAG TPA: hypothetical protein P5244_08640 [Syntrophales bacterium]|nr:hypothetical protein [Syntrophales bacterium]